MGMDTVVLSLGGSVIVPDGIDTDFLLRFKKLIMSLSDTRFIIICGGGKICRRYQNTAKDLSDISRADLDWIGIKATRLNAELVRAGFGKEACPKVLNNPDEKIMTPKRIIIGAGFEPGSSTDLRAVQLANRFGALRVINMSNIDYVYDTDPRENPDARQLPHVSWPEFIKLVGNDWEPGLNMPFDPIASKEACRLGLKVIIIGNRIDNLERLLKGSDFDGTVIA